MTLRPLVIVAAALALASASCVSSKKYAALKAERDGLFNDWTTVKGNYARQQAENQTIQALLDEVNVKVLKGVVYISLADNMLFRSGSYEVNSRAMQTLSKIAKIIKDYRGYSVLVEGNTDPVPISRTNIRNNWDLSALRASSVVQVLQNDFGVDPSRLSAAGRGEYNPIADNSSELGRQRNRRTEIIITPELDQFLDLIDKAPADSGRASL